MQAHEVQVANDREYMTAVAKLNADAIRQQEERRVSEEAERKRIAAEAAADEAEFQSVRSAAVSKVSAKHGAGRRGNVTRSLQGRQPAKEQLVRNEPEGIAAKIARGGKN